MLQSRPSTNRPTNIGRFAVIGFSSLCKKPLRRVLRPEWERSGRNKVVCRPVLISGFGGLCRIIVPLPLGATALSLTARLAHQPEHSAHHPVKGSGGYSPIHSEELQVRYSPLPGSRPGMLCTQTPSCMTRLTVSVVQFPSLSRCRGGDSNPEPSALSVRRSY